MAQSNYHCVSPWVPRLLAGLLAIGGSFWGLILSPWLFRPEASPLAWAVFGPGYLITIGYIIRTISMPPLGVRYLIWVSSLLVQGAWLLWLIWAVIVQLADDHSVNEPSMMAAWWFFATVASAVALSTEGGDPNTNAAPDEAACSAIRQAESKKYIPTPLPELECIS